MEYSRWVEKCFIQRTRANKWVVLIQDHTKTRHEEERDWSKVWGCHGNASQGKWRYALQFLPTVLQWWYSYAVGPASWLDVQMFLWINYSWFKCSFFASHLQLFKLSQQLLKFKMVIKLKKKEKKKKKEKEIASQRKQVPTLWSSGNIQLRGIINFITQWTRLSLNIFWLKMRKCCYPLMPNAQRSLKNFANLEQFFSRHILKFCERIDVSLWLLDCCRISL